MVVEITTDVEEKKPDRPPPKTTATIYPVLNKHFEKTVSMKELTTSKISSHKESTLSKEVSTHANADADKLAHNDAVADPATDTQVKKPPVPLKKSPTPISSVGGLLTGLKNKMLSSTDKEKSSPAASSGSSSGGEWDRTDGAAPSKPPPPPPAATTTTTTNTTNTTLTTTTTTSTATFDHIERNSILNDPRAGRVKAPRRRPPSQALRDDAAPSTPPTPPTPLSNGHTADKPVSDKAEEIKPRAREWEKHKAPWMEELKLNQAKKTTFDNKGRASEPARAATTDRILDCGMEEKKSSTHSMEMSKSTSSITSRMSVLESFEETKVRHSLDSKKETTSSRDSEPIFSKPVHSPTAAGRTLMSMLEDIKKPPAPAPPVVSARTNSEHLADNTHKLDKSTTLDKQTEINTVTKTSSVFEKTNTLERIEKLEEKLPERPTSILSGEKSMSNTLERRMHSVKVDKNPSEGTDALIAQLNSRISNLEKLLELQNTMFKTAIDELNSKLKVESEKRQELKVQLDKLAHCVTQV